MYILRCADDSLYVGCTDDLTGRLEQHNQGVGSHFTSRRLPVALAYAEEHQSRDDALERERQLKRWTRAKKEALIAGDRSSLKRL